MRIGDRRQWYFTATVRIPDVKHKVRIVILWHYRNDEACGKILVTNRVTWEASRIVRVYRRRGTGTETFHRDGKPQLGWGDCRRRDVQGQTRHMHLVMLAYSLLMGELKQGRAKEWALHRLMTIGEACRAMAKETLRTTLSWAIEQVTRWERPCEHVVSHLGYPDFAKDQSISFLSHLLSVSQTEFSHANPGGSPIVRDMGREAGFGKSFASEAG